MYWMNIGHLDGKMISLHTLELELSAHLNAPWEAVFDAKNKDNEKTNSW